MEVLPPVSDMIRRCPTASQMFPSTLCKAFSIRKPTLCGRNSFTKRPRAMRIASGITIDWTALFGMREMSATQVAELWRQMVSDMQPWAHSEFSAQSLYTDLISLSVNSHLCDCQTKRAWSEHYIQAECHWSYFDDSRFTVRAVIVILR